MTSHRAVLVGIQLPTATDEGTHASLDELARLCTTLGLDVVGRVTQKLPSRDKRRVLGDGKLVELADWTGGPGWIYRGPKLTRAEHEERFGEDEGRREAEEGREVETDAGAEVHLVLRRHDGIAHLLPDARW